MSRRVRTPQSRASKQCSSSQASVQLVASCDAMGFPAPAQCFPVRTRHGYRHPIHPDPPAPTGCWGCLFPQYHGMPLGPCSLHKPPTSSPHASMQQHQHGQLSTSSWVRDKAVVHRLPTVYVAEPAWWPGCRCWQSCCALGCIRPGNSFHLTKSNRRTCSSPTAGCTWLAGAQPRPHTPHMTYTKRPRSRPPGPDTMCSSRHPHVGGRKLHSSHGGSCLRVRWTGTCQGAHTPVQAHAGTPTPGTSAMITLATWQHPSSWLLAVYMAAAQLHPQSRIPCLGASITKA
jgi:hypothetical protein